MMACEELDQEKVFGLWRVIKLCDVDLPGTLAYLKAERRTGQCGLSYCYTHESASSSLCYEKELM